jgi:hypothetical protein
MALTAPLSPVGWLRAARNSNAVRNGDEPMRKLTLVLACGLTLAAFPALAFEGCSYGAHVIASTPATSTVATTTETQPATEAAAPAERSQPTTTAEIATPKPAAN